jgi:hypothetical protein
VANLLPQHLFESAWFNNQSHLVAKQENITGEKQVRKFGRQSISLMLGIFITHKNPPSSVGFEPATECPMGLMASSLTTRPSRAAASRMQRRNGVQWLRRYQPAASVRVDWSLCMLLHLCIVFSHELGVSLGYTFRIYSALCVSLHTFWSNTEFEIGEIKKVPCFLCSTSS